MQCCSPVFGDSGATHQWAPYARTVGTSLTLDKNDALDGEETFEVDEELEAVLLESIAQGRRGQTISVEELLREMRSRE